MHVLKIKRVYEPYSKEDGYRILIDRLWPRGLTKEKAHIDLWLKEIAPSDSLRKWFSHDPSKFEEFKKRYTSEIKEENINKILEILKKQDVTLLYAAKDQEHNDAVVLYEILKRR
mgnify:FL=1